MAAVLKTVTRKGRGFESYPLRQVFMLEILLVHGYNAATYQI